jgi:hypothetical protein
MRPIESSNLISLWSCNVRKTDAARDLERVGDVLNMLNPYELWCLGYTKLGQPLHPLMLKNEVERVRFKA